MAMMSESWRLKWVKEWKQMDKKRSSFVSVKHKTKNYYKKCHWQVMSQVIVPPDNRYARWCGTYTADASVTCIRRLSVHSSDLRWSKHAKQDKNYLLKLSADCAALVSISYRGQNIQFFRKSVSKSYLTEGVSCREEGPLQGFPNWGSFIEKSVSYIEGASYRECIL